MRYIFSANLNEKIVLEKTNKHSVELKGAKYFLKTQDKIVILRNIFMFPNKM